MQATKIQNFISKGFSHSTSCPFFLFTPAHVYRFRKASESIYFNMKYIGPKQEHQTNTHKYNKNIPIIGGFGRSTALPFTLASGTITKNHP